ncbi:serine palmitoyltransferase small subunit A isoform X2 [Canis lupus baileyi]|uniref:serine palmitoyltransferase small subunit A isoform X2 n=1 Tax=Canis lupus baileyi TaxID=143281 RepID=UPI003B970066
MKIEEMYFQWWRSLRCEQSWKEPEAAEDTRDEVEPCVAGAVPDEITPGGLQQGVTGRSHLSWQHISLPSIGNSHLDNFP